MDFDKPQMFAALTNSNGPSELAYRLAPNQCQRAMLNYESFWKERGKSVDRVIRTAYSSLHWTIRCESKAGRISCQALRKNLLQNFL